MAVRRAEAAVARSMAERSLSRRARGIADRTRSAEELLVREGRSELRSISTSARWIWPTPTRRRPGRTSTSVLERVRLLSLRGELGTALLGAEPACSAAQ